MKKARIFLTAIAVLAVVGGALAFKAKGLASIYCLTSAGCVKTMYQSIDNDLDTTTQPCGFNNPYYTDHNCITAHYYGTVWVTEL